MSRVNRVIGQKNVESGNFQANTIVAQECLIVKGAIKSEGEASFTNGLTTDLIGPRSTGGKVRIIGLELINSVILPGQRVIYVGKHGINTNNGQHISQALLDFTTAIFKASSSGPSSTNIIQIICHDALEYSEDLTIPEWINISANNATLKGTITTMGNHVVSFGKVESPTSAVMSAGPNTEINIGQIDIPSGVGIEHSNSSALRLRVGIANVGSGILVRTNIGPIECTIQHIVLNGGTAFMIVGNNLTAYVDTITELIPSTAIYIISGSMVGYIQTIATSVATSVAIAGSLDIIVNTSSGTNTGISNILMPSHINDFNNPHNVTLDQLTTPLTLKGDILTFNGTNIVKLAAGMDTQVLTVDSSTATGLRWGTGGGGGSGSTRASYNLTSIETEVSNVVWKKAATFQWFQTRFGIYTNGILLLRVIDPCIIRLRNIDLGVDLCTTASLVGVGSYSVSIPSISLPTADATLELQVMQNTPAIAILNSAVLELDM